MTRESNYHCEGNLKIHSRLLGTLLCKNFVEHRQNGQFPCKIFDLKLISVETEILNTLISKK